jgi:hypothetical protein
MMTFFLMSRGRPSQRRLVKEDMEAVIYCQTGTVCFCLPWASRHDY